MPAGCQPPSKAELAARRAEARSQVKKAGVKCLETLAQALALDPDTATEAWAHLYQAHVFHDAERWGDALTSYEQVDRSVFTGGQTWRSDVLAEQRAECLHMIGRSNEAEQELVRILDRYEEEPHVAFAAMSAALWRLAEATSTELRERAEVVWKLALDSDGASPRS